MTCKSNPSAQNRQSPLESTKVSRLAALILSLLLTACQSQATATSSFTPTTLAQDDQPANTAGPGY